MASSASSSSYSSSSGASQASASSAGCGEASGTVARRSPADRSGEMTGDYVPTVVSRHRSSESGLGSGAGRRRKAKGKARAKAKAKAEAERPSGRRRSGDEIGHHSNLGHLGGLGFASAYDAIPSAYELPDKRDGVFTWEEIAKHNTPDSCWLVSRGKVYDVTPFLKKHPAGVGAILRHAGTDSTEDFDFHSKGARAQWKEYKIGKVKKDGCSVS